MVDLLLHVFRSNGSVAVVSLHRVPPCATVGDIKARLRSVTDCVREGTLLFAGGKEASDDAEAAQLAGQTILVLARGPRNRPGLGEGLRFGATGPKPARRMRMTY